MLGLAGSEARAGDRVVSMAGSTVLGSSQQDWETLRHRLAGQVEVVLVRSKRSTSSSTGEAGRGAGQAGVSYSSEDITGIREDIAAIQSTLEQKLSQVLLCSLL